MDSCVAGGFAAEVEAVVARAAASAVLAVAADADSAVRAVAAWADFEVVSFPVAELRSCWDFRAAPQVVEDSPADSAALDERPSLLAADCREPRP